MAVPSSSGEPWHDADQASVELEKLLLEPEASVKHSKARTRQLGLLAIFVLIWVSVVQPEASQALQSACKFNKPFFIVGFNHTITMALLPVVYVYHRVSDAAAGRQDKLDFVSVLKRHSVLPFRDLLWMAAYLNAFFYAADYFWYAALAAISVAASTAISNTSPLLVYCFSICFLHERVTWRKLGGVLLSFGGATLIAFYQNGTKPSQMLDSTFDDATLIASALVTVSAIIYAAYQVAFVVVVGEDIDDLSTLMILTGFSGLFTIPIWVAGSLLLAWTPIASIHEPLGWPDTDQGVLMLIVEGLLCGVNNALLPLALCWTSALETSVGCMLAIPLAGVWDSIFHHTHFSWECIVGSVLVMSGFGALESAKLRLTPSNVQPS